MIRLAIIGLLVLIIVASFAYVAGWLSPGVLTPARFADGFEQVNGIHGGFRRNHAKGVCISGSFQSNGQGTRLSKAAVFRAGNLPVIGRFSLTGGNPYVADGPLVVRGLGLSFRPASGQEWRTAMINLPVFPLKTPQAFYDQLFTIASLPRLDDRIQPGSKRFSPPIRTWWWLGRSSGPIRFRPGSPTAPSTASTRFVS